MSHLGRPAGPDERRPDESPPEERPPDEHRPDEHRPVEHTAPGWYADPWRQAQWRWWDGMHWTGWTSVPAGARPPETVRPPAPQSRRPEASPAAEPVPTSQRRRLIGELVLVMAVFPLPYSVSAVEDLVSAATGHGAGQRTPVLISGEPATSFVLEVILVLLPFAAAALAAYLLSVTGPFGSRSGSSGSNREAERATAPRRGEGGLACLGLGASQLRGDLALVIVVFVVCFLVPIDGGNLILNVLHVHAISPATTGRGAPRYYTAIDVVDGFASGIVEEIVVLGYLVRRLEQLALKDWQILVIAVAVRGSYHLYYGWGVLPILGWAALSVVAYRAYRRLLPFILVHVVWDSSSFVAAAMSPRTGSRFVLIEAAVLLPVSVAMWLAWRDRIPRPRVGPPGRGAR